VIRRHFLTYLALSTMAVAQPLLDLYGKNPTVFSAAKMSNVEVGIFLAVVMLAPALLAAALDRLSRWFGPKVNESFRLWMIAGFSFLFGLAVARWLDVNTNVGSVGIALLSALVVTRLYDTRKVVRDWSRLLAFMSVVVLVGAVIQLSPVLVESNGPTSDAVVANKNVSVFQVIFDEFPLYALLDADGNINAERFPGFAALASESTWYRNAVAESNFTHQAVPALMASAVPQQSGGPFLAQYPKNIFTLFAGKTAVGGIEPVTSLCPKNICGGAGNSDGTFSLSRMKTFFRDASYVYAQRVLPPVLRSRVPSIEGAWGGFGAVANKFKEQFDVGALSQIDAMSQGVSAFVNDGSARVQVTHVLTPHAPWRVTPDLRVAPLSKSISTANPESEDGVRDTYQTFLYQLAATDRALATVIADLKQAGRWETTMFIVSADHGISFLPTMPQRHTDFSDMQQANDIYRVPLFVKYPAQTEGVVSDCAVTNLDVLPSVVETTGTTSSWKWAGQSFATSCPKGRTRSVVSATGESAVFNGGFAEARERAAHYATVVSNIGGIRRVAAIGQSGSLIGKPISFDSVDTNVTSWTLAQKKMFSKVSGDRGARVPSLVTGGVTLSSPLDDGTEGIIAIDGVAAGVIGELSGARDAVEFTAILDFSLLTEGKHTVEMFLRLPNGEITRVGPPA
jgi:Sulfatase